MSNFKHSWKHFLLSNPDLDVSKKHILKIKELSSPSTPFDESFEQISKNQGISLICTDPTESFIQLFHHCHVIGGCWANPSKTFVSILGTDKTAKPIQLILKSVKTLKTKTDLLEELMGGEPTNDQNKKPAKSEFNFCNILPILRVLTKAYLELESYSPHDVAQAFYIAMKSFDSNESENINQEVVQLPTLVDEKDPENIKSPDEEDGKSTSLNQAPNDLASKGILQEFVHVLRFCHLCYKKKIPPVSYSVDTTPAIDSWFQALSFNNLKVLSIRGKHQQQRDDDISDSDDDISSPDHKILKKDQVFLSTMPKINDAMDKNYKEKSDMEPGFSRLEEHRKNLILNASAVPPYDNPASQPTEFFMTFLAKKSQFKAKDMILHRLQSDKISFNPGSL
jgi:hypothetical protein